MRQGNAVPGVAHVVHKSQRPVGEHPFGGVILDHEATACDPRRLGQQLERTLGVMNDVDQHDRVEAGILERNRLAVERPNLDVQPRPDQHVDALQRHIRSQPQDRGCHHAVACTDVQHAGVRRKQ
jgi:hypothetical protein